LDLPPRRRARSIARSLQDLKALREDPGRAFELARRDSTSPQHGNRIAWALYGPCEGGSRRRLTAPDARIRRLDGPPRPRIAPVCRRCRCSAGQIRAHARILDRILPGRSHGAGPRPPMVRSNSTRIGSSSRRCDPKIHRERRLPEESYAPQTSRIAPVARRIVSILPAEARRRRSDTCLAVTKPAARRRPGPRRACRAARDSPIATMNPVSTRGPSRIGRRFSSRRPPLPAPVA
jgi:hypothetical protein